MCWEGDPDRNGAGRAGEDGRAGVPGYQKKNNKKTKTGRKNGSLRDQSSG